MVYTFAYKRVGLIMLYLKAVSPCLWRSYSTYPWLRDAKAAFNVLKITEQYRFL